MNGPQPVAWLMMFTLVTGVAIAGGAFLYFLRSRWNRQIAAAALTGEGQNRPGVAPDGALPELLSILALAIAVMGLLAIGAYVGRS